MSSAWLLPEHIADVLPAEARRVEDLRRTMLDVARSHGFELVMPPLLEHLESLLSGSGPELDHELDLRTFKLVDQLSGRTLGVRADTTPQVARIDAHLLNRQGVARLCYCGPVLHTRPAAPLATREPLQFGAETYGHAGLEADLEILEIAIASLSQVGLRDLALDMADARIVRGVLSGVPLDAIALEAVVAALAAKDAAQLVEVARAFPEPSRLALTALTSLYGGVEVLALARSELPDRPLIRAALDDLTWLSEQVRRAQPGVALGFDLADLRGYAYYSGPRFALYASGSSDAVARGGRYDEVGAAFGRNRPAVGFSMDLKQVAALARPPEPRGAIRAAWSEEPELRAMVRRLRESGETVVWTLPGHEHEAQEFACDRELVASAEGWQLQPI